MENGNKGVINLGLIKKIGYAIINNNLKNMFEKIEYNENLLSNIEIDFKETNSNAFGFTLKIPETIKNYYIKEYVYDELLYIYLVDNDNNESKDFLFNKNKELISWKERQKELENRQIEIKEFEGYKVEGKRIVDLEYNSEEFHFKVYKNGEEVYKGDISSMGVENIFQEAYYSFGGAEIQKNAEEEKKNKYENGSLSDKNSYWVELSWYYLREGGQFNINNIRNSKEPNIDLFIESIIGAIENISGMTKQEILNKFFILDNKAKEYIKTSKIEGLDISNDDLAEKVGDLFYDSLASFISSLGDKIKNNLIIQEKLENTDEILKLQKVLELLDDASKHILTAWEICLPYVSNNFPEMKHTTEIKGININKAELVNRIGNLETNILADFLEKLSLKIQKDGEADKGRGRIKLANELFACADKLEVASKTI